VACSGRKNRVPALECSQVDEQDVDAWWRHLKSRGVELRDEGPVVGEGDVQIKGFGFTGPEGYTLEIFAWLRK